MVNSDVHTLARHAVPRTDPDSDAAAFACIYAGLDGQVGALLPCDEKRFSAAAGLGRCAGQCAEARGVAFIRTSTGWRRYIRGTFLMGLYSGTVAAAALGGTWL